MWTNFTLLPGNVTRYRHLALLLFLLLVGLSRGRVEAQSFTDVSSQLPNLSSLSGTAVAWGDYDNDNRLDLLVMSVRESRLCHNTGNGFEDKSSLLPNLPRAYRCSVAWGDYDNDGKLDLVLAGFSSTTLNFITKLYHNTGTGFEDVSSLLSALTGTTRGSVAWGDYDNDGKLDLLITGYQGSVGIRLYHNTGTGFENKTSLLPAPTGIGDCGAAWGDYDNDSKLDLIITGISGIGIICRLYHNTGTGFENKSSLLPNLPGITTGAVAWGDYDNDGKLDLILMGDTGSESVCRLYRNTGAGFEDKSSLLSNPPGLNNGSVAWGDYDNDGKLDLIFSGNTSSGPTSKLYHNTGTSFEDASSQLPSLPGAYYSSVAWGDYDNDGKLDLIIVGYTGTGAVYVTKLYRNLSQTANVAPTAPSSLTSTPSSDGKSVVLAWQPPTDDHTPSGALSYNLYVSDSPQSQTIVSAMADPTTGFRRVVRLGNSQPTSFSLTGLSQGKTYYWSVQSLDGSFAGSPFASQQSFSINYDLTSILYARPSLTYGPTSFSVVVDVVELNGVATAGPITLKISRDSRVSLSLPSSMTSVGNRSVQNALWRLDNSTDGYYTLTTDAPIPGGNRLSVGLTGQLSPGATTGIVTISSVLAGNQGDINLNNNTDADKVEYFSQ